ncbi:hypothetical protein [Treponema pedis]|uniref:hypothetical protein n=1 Tax=Treponema pedis TaxID=409322 RepID=UPI00040EEBCC|nr:hypothetical protein [Treponema pedis]
MKHFDFYNFFAVIAVMSIPLIFSILDKMFFKKEESFLDLLFKNFLSGLIAFIYFVFSFLTIICFSFFWK